MRSGPMFPLAYRWLLASLVAVSVAMPEAAAPGARCLAQSAGEAKGDAANASHDVQALVRQLGDPSVQRRDEASRLLFERADWTVMEAVREGLRSSDAEVRRRCRVILDRVYTRIHQQQLTEFIEHPERDVQLPGWGRFRKLVGDDEVARALFVDMQTAEPVLLWLMAQGERSLPERLENRVRMLQAPNFGLEVPVSVDSLAALMFVACHEELRPTTETLDRLQQAALQQVFQNAVQRGPRKEALRKLVNAWMRSTLDRADLYAYVQMALQLDLEAGSQAGLKLLERQGLPPEEQLLSILAVGRFGTADNIPELEGYLQDRRNLLIQPRPEGEVVTQFRDIVLAVLLHLAGENLADYGLNHVQKSTETLYDVSTIYFASDDARAAALNKWQSRKNRASSE